LPFGKRLIEVDGSPDTGESYARSMIAMILRHRPGPRLVDVVSIVSQVERRFSHPLDTARSEKLVTVGDVSICCKGASGKRGRGGVTSPLAA